MIVPIVNVFYQAFASGAVVYWKNLVSDPDTRKSYYFRFYDPVVLDTFIPTCTARQRAELFGEITAFLVEGRAGEILRHPAEVP